MPRDLQVSNHLMDTLILINIQFSPLAGSSTGPLLRGRRKNDFENDFEKEDFVLLAKRPQLRQWLRPGRGGRVVPKEDALQGQGPPPPAR
jgi:hypothetical protein